MSRAPIQIALVAGVALASAGAGECGGDDGGPAAAPLADFVLTAPDGFEELVPGSTIDVAWDVTPAPGLSIELDAVDGETAIPIGRAELAPGMAGWNGHDRAGVIVPAGNYQVRALALGPDDGTVDTAEGDNAHLIVVQGVRFRDATLAFTGAQASRDLVVTTVARSPMTLALALDPDLAVDGDEIALLTATIPGELAPIARSYPFTGRTASNDPIAGGTYTLTAIITARGGTVTYRLDGPTLTWTP